MPNYDDWKAGEQVNPNELYGLPPESADPGTQFLYGARDNEGHRIYEIPARAKVADIVHFFEVGGFRAQSYGYDKKQTIDLVAEKATKISEIIPCRAIFADGAGLKLKFERPITDEELSQIEQLFPVEIAMQAGMEVYLSTWDGQSLKLTQVKEENLIQFWWD